MGLRRHHGRLGRGRLRRPTAPPQGFHPRKTHLAGRRHRRRCPETVYPGRKQNRHQLRLSPTGRNRPPPLRLAYPCFAEKNRIGSPGRPTSTRKQQRPPAYSPTPQTRHAYPNRFASPWKVRPAPARRLRPNAPQPPFLPLPSPPAAIPTARAVSSTPPKTAPSPYGKPADCKLSPMTTTSAARAGKSLPKSEMPFPHSGPNASERQPCVLCFLCPHCP